MLSELRRAGGDGVGLSRPAGRPEPGREVANQTGSIYSKLVAVPVGGSGYTLDAHQAVSVVRQLDPKVVIPTHFADKVVRYEVPQMELEPFLKELGAPQYEKTAKWKLKGPLPEILTVIELERTA